MKSFFSRIQNKFGASYGGRYIETILEEVSFEDDLICKILGGTNKKCYLETEYRFIINERERIADIVVKCTSSDQIIAMVEIKYDDHLSKKNHAQLNDYIDYCTLNSCNFTYLTQYYPPGNDLNIVKNSGYKHLLFSQLAENLNKKNNHIITTLFVRYLEDKGLSMRTLEIVSIYKLLVRLFNPNSGQSKIQNNKSMISGYSGAIRPPIPVASGH